MLQSQNRRLSLALSTISLAALFAITGCAGGSSSTPPNSNPNTSSAQLSVSPATIDFGSVPVGTNHSQSGSLTAANANVTVTSASWSGSGYSLSGITFPATVPAGQSVPFTVNFDPSAAGSSPGSVTFNSSAVNSPTKETLAGSGLASLHSVSLSWNASTSTVIGYHVYRGTQTGGPYTLLNSSVQPATTYTDANVVSGTTYFYVVTAVDVTLQESPFSNETIALIPVP